MEQRETREAGQRVLVWTFTHEETVRILGPGLSLTMPYTKGFFLKLANRIVSAGYSGEMEVNVRPPRTMYDDGLNKRLEIRLICAPTDPIGFPQLMEGHDTQTNPQSE